MARSPRSSDRSTTEPADAPSPMGKKLKVVAITFAVVLGTFALLFFLTENESTAPFVYAIF